MTDPVRVLIVDDSVVIRRLLTTIIEEDPDLEVAGIAQNGNIALQRIRQLQPDVVTLDVEMPELDGLGALKELRKEHRDLPVVMFSTLTAQGAEATLSALELGASDYVCKPANVGSVNVAMDRVREELIPKLKGLCKRSTKMVFPTLEREVTAGAPTGKVELVAIGSSTGGPNALADVIGALPDDLAVPVVIVQHMPPVFTRFLAERLDANCAVTVHEGEDGQKLERGHVYIAPGGHHMVVRKSATGLPYLELNDDPEENFCRPAVDVLFRSVAKTYGGNVLAAVLTGMGQDGRDGCIPLKEAGAHVIVQDEASSVVWGMPGAVATADLADEILPLPAIGPALTHRVEEANPLAAMTTRK